MSHAPRGTPIHLVPPDSSSVTPCCGREVLELPMTDRLTRNPDLVTCSRGESNLSPAGDPTPTTERAMTDDLPTPEPLVGDANRAEARIRDLERIVQALEYVAAEFVAILDTHASVRPETIDRCRGRLYAARWEPYQISIPGVRTE